MDPIIWTLILTPCSLAGELAALVGVEDLWPMLPPGALSKAFYLTPGLLRFRKLRGLSYRGGVDKLSAPTYYAPLATDRTQRQIDRLLNEADEFFAEGNWGRVRDTTGKALKTCRQVEGELDTVLSQKYYPIC